MGFTDSRILIAGLGLIGGSVAKALKQSGYKNIYAYDKDGETLKSAELEGIIEKGYSKLCGSIEQFDFVLCCLSPVFVLPLYKSAAPYLKEGGVFAEVGGIKQVIIKELEEAMQPSHELLSLHPMAGSEKTGYQYSDKDMFEGSVLVITPGKSTKNKALEWAHTLKEALRFSEIKELPAEKHDEIIACVSHIPHIAALCIKAMNKDTDNELYAGGSYRSSTRVAEINSALWAGLMSDNKGHLLSAIERFEAELGGLKAAINKGDSEELKELLDDMSGQKSGQKG